MGWAFPDPAVRLARLRGLWGFLAGEGYLPIGASTVIADSAAALWMPPGQRLDDQFWEARSRQFVEALEGDVDRLGAMSEEMGAHHPHDRDHWYLMAIGVSPVAQGRRFGSALLDHTLKQADLAGAPAYLEATSVRSRSLYASVGFEVLAEFIPAEGAPPLWAMWRDPQTP
jgi:ribosomal protein S18 acetylase RimI-like enzyme